MKFPTLDFILDGITEQDFLQWKHHPVSKVWFRYLRDQLRVTEAEQLAGLRGATSAPDPFKLGDFSGFARAIFEMSEPQFESITKFYPIEEEQ